MDDTEPFRAPPPRERPAPSPRWFVLYCNAAGNFKSHTYHHGHVAAERFAAACHGDAVWAFIFTIKYDGYKSNICLHRSYGKII